MTDTGSSRHNRNVRCVAAVVINAVSQHGQSLTRQIELLETQLPVAERPLLREICYGSCRWYLQLDALLQQLLKKPLRQRDIDIRALMICGIYQLHYMRIKPHAVVQETVNAAKIMGKPALAGLVNGVLRNFIRRSESLLAEIEQSPVTRFAMPQWLLERLQQAWPTEWQEVLASLQQQAPLCLRVNLAREKPAAVTAALLEAGVTSRPVRGVPSALLLDQALPVERLPGFAEGRVSVQDAGAQLAAEILDPQPGSRVLDACAAPGGKSGHLLERVSGDLQLTAMDIDTARLQRVSENLDRLGWSARLCTADAGQPGGDWGAQQYDAILLDVPCSATGVIRRHPDIKLLRHAADVDKLVDAQRRILSTVWPLLRRGGRLLYATCSLLPEENEQQLDWLMTREEAEVIRIDTSAEHVTRGHGIQTLPGRSGMDGFFYALLQKP